jgi:hypothetical protein
VATHVVSLLPFNREQIAEWSQKWNELTGQHFDGTKFWQEEKKNRGDLHELATQPLLLYLLAKLEQDGNPIDPTATGTSRSGVYRHIIQWVCNRQEAKGTDSERMSAGQMRKLLRLTGFCTMFLAKREVHIQDLQGLLADSGLSAQLVQNKQNYQAERTFLSFAFLKLTKQLGNSNTNNLESTWPQNTSPTG